MYLPFFFGNIATFIQISVDNGNILFLNIYRSHKKRHTIVEAIIIQKKESILNKISSIIGNGISKSALMFNIRTK